MLILRDGTAEQRNKDDPEALKDESLRSLFFDELPIELPMDKLFGEKSKRRAKLKEMSFAELMEARESALEEEVGEAGISEKRMKIQMHIQKSFAMAFSVFSLAIFGVPLAIRVGRKESYANLAIALVIAMTYYFLMIAVSWLEGNPAVRPDLLIWLPNIFFQTIGFFLTRKSSRH